MDMEEREAYRQFVRAFYRVVYHMPEYATAGDYQRLLKPLLENAQALLGDEEEVVLQIGEQAE